jgi:hypothetical protein
VRLPPALSHVKVDFGLSGAQRRFGDWTTQVSSFAGPMARQIVKTTQIVDTMVDTQPAMTIVGRMGFFARTGDSWYPNSS